MVQEAVQVYKKVFKKGSTYSRKDVGWILLPEEGRPAGGDWDTGYVRVNEKLIIFMNIQMLTFLILTKLLMNKYFLDVIMF